MRGWEHERLLKGSKAEGARCRGPRHSQERGGRDLRRIPGGPQALAQTPPPRGGGLYLTPKPSPGRTPRILATIEERQALWAQLEANDDAPRWSATGAVGSGTGHCGVHLDDEPGGA